VFGVLSSGESNVIGQLPLIGRWWWYRAVMKIAHRFNWHYAPPCPQIEPGETRYWCHWCGLKYTARSGRAEALGQMNQGIKS
jgi:hypothetical protein